LVRIQVGSRLIRFGSFQVRVYIGSIKVRVSSNLVLLISSYGSNRVNKIYGQFKFDLGQIASLQFQVGSVLGRFNFKFLVEISSTLFHVGSDLISNRLVGSIGSGHFYQVYLIIIIQVCLMQKKQKTECGQEFFSKFRIQSFRH